MKAMFLKINRDGFAKKVYAFFVLSLCLSCIVIRAHYSAITLDEGHTYVNYVEKFRFERIEEFFEDYDGRANNHLLNTVLIYLVDHIVGIHYDEFLVRFPNVCFGVCFGILCLYLYGKRRISTLEFSMLMLNVSVNNAFALARGYGMATCLSMFAIYFVKCYVESDYKDDKALSGAILFFTLAESANTVVLLLTASVAILLFFIMFRKKLLFPYIKKACLFLVPMTLLNLLLLVYHIYISADSEGKALASYHGSPVSGIIGSFAGIYTGRFAVIGTGIFIILLAGSGLLGIIKKKKLFFTWLLYIYFALCSAMAVIFGKGMPSALALLPACPMMIFAVSESVVCIWDWTVKNLCREWNRRLWILFTLGCSSLFLLRFVREVDFTVNNDLRVHLYDSVMGSYEVIPDAEELHWLHMPFYQKQFLCRYGYDIYRGKYTIESMSLSETLWMLQDQKFDALLDITDKDMVRRYGYEFEKLGIDVKSLPEFTDFILIDHGSEVELEYIYSCKGTDNTRDTILGTMSLFYGDDGSYGVYMDGQECLVLDPEQQPGISICVWHNGTEEPFDHKVFTVG